MTGFALELRKATATAHRDAESTGFLSRLAAGAVPVAGFAALVSQHYLIYRELEEAGARMRADPVAGAFVDAALDRLPALEADLRELLGRGWAGEVTALPATVRYTDRLRGACAEWPAGFIAHHYVRYLGDLSGGLMLGPALRSSYGTGTSFYVFDGIADPRGYKDVYRERLDALPYAPEELDRLAAEAAIAYQLNIDVLRELGRDFPDDLASAA
ncbi:biliverdin-producing heme oxygenase [Catenuloplanes japonicus]|uniref:biliverdin-producing heme oxygenase n=1 Tax=Catenuloplanes japonicus TaxID=33876 RepID=UPI000525E2F8|nr:biliverdin-producing heme oxygenase [Catenuloplanes japonicus]